MKTVNFRNLNLAQNEVAAIENFVVSQNTLHDVVIAGLALSPPFDKGDSDE